MAETLPTGEQIRFRSANTGDHVLDTYLESAEIGGRSLTDLLDDLFDPANNGTFRASNFEFRFDPATDKLQFRVGQFASATAGFTDLTTFFSIEGTFSTSTTYNNFDVVTLSNKDVYIVHGLSSGTTFSSESNFISSANTEKLVDVSNAQDWAVKVNGIVDSTDYSSKAYAIGGTGVDTTTGSAKDWAIKTSGTVGNTNEYSAKFWATSTNVVNVATNIANINTAAGAIANINTAATNIANINTVAGISSDVSSVAAIDANVTSVAGITSNVTTVAGIAANVTSVAGVASSVPTVAGIASNVTTVANNNANVTAVGTNVASVNTVAAEINNNKLQTVANNINAVVTAADDLNEATSEIDTVANSITNVDAVGTNIANVNAVAGNATNINTVAGVSSNVSTVAGSIANVNTVANIASGAQTFVVTVVGGVFYIDGVSAPTLSLVRGFTYTFDQSHSSNSGHPLAFKNGSSSYTTGVTVNGSAGNTGASVVFVVPNNAPATGLRYYCTVHGNGMGNTISTSSNDIGTVSSISSEITAVAGNSSNINTLAGINSQISTLAAISTDVTTAATNTTAFNNIYLGAQSSAPTQDPDGSALDLGDLYFDTSSDVLKVRSSSGWINAGSSVNGTSARFTYTATANQTTFSGNDSAGNSLAYDAGFLDIYMNGVKLAAADFTATTGTSVVLATGAAAGDTLEMIAFGTFVLLNQSINDMTDVTTGGISNGQFLQFNSSTGNFEPATVATSLVADTSPQLGGNLDLNSRDITGTGNLNITGNVSLSGTVDGRDVAADGTKLDGIETGATADQSDAEIKTAYENNSDTNAFTDALQTKLNGIASSADNYASWTISDGSNTEAIASGNTLTIAGGGDTSTAYDSGTNTLTVTTNAPEAFPSGTSMLFQQSAAPTGWTKQTTHNDKALRIVTGSVSTGGSTGFASAMGTPSVSGSVSLSGNPSRGNLSGNTSINGNPNVSGNIHNRTLSINQIPSHSHSMPQPWPNGYNRFGNTVRHEMNQNTGNRGGNGGHNHGHNFSGSRGNLGGNATINGNPSIGNLAGSLSSSTASINVAYVDFIIANKD